MDEWVKRAKGEFAEQMRDARAFMQASRAYTDQHNLTQALENFRYAAHAIGHGEGIADTLYLAGHRTKAMEDRIESSWRMLTNLESKIDMKIPDTLDIVT